VGCSQWGIVSGMGRERGTTPIWVVVLGWVLFAVVLVLAFGISTHDGRNDLGCEGRRKWVPPTRTS
jgi:type VI protein secretion system component VasF